MRATLLETGELDAYGQMALDEAALESADPDALLLRFYRWPEGTAGGAAGKVVHPYPAAATFGYFQRHEEAVSQVRGRGLPVAFPLVRRPTGGGVVLHDGDVTFSLVFPWGRLSAASWVYKDLHRAVHLGLKARGLATRLWSPPGPARSAPPPASCYPDPSPIDLVREDGRKCLGGALRRRRGIGLYQGSLRPEGFGAPREDLVGAILEGMSLQWTTIFAPGPVPPGVLRRAERLRDEKYLTDRWNCKR